jgi:hypothetical protein
LTNPQNQKQWSEAIINDLVRHLSGLKNKSHEILGFMNGRTQLPIPAGAEKVTDKDIEMAKMYEFFLFIMLIYYVFNVLYKEAERLIKI